MEEIDFLDVGTNLGKLKVDSMIFGCAQSEMAMAIQFTRLSNLLYLNNEFMNWADFLNADSGAIIFGQMDIRLFDF